VLFWSLVTAACVPLFVTGSGRWLGFDDWTLLITRQRVLTSQGLLDFLLRPHNEHFLGGLMFWDLGLASLFGIDSYLPWTITIVAALVFTAWVLRRLMERIGVSPLAASLVAPTVMIWTDFGGALSWAPETVFVLYLALVLTHLTLVVSEGQTSVRRETAGMALSLAAVLMHSGAAAAVVPIVGVLLLQRRWRAAALSSIPVAFYGTWLLTWGQKEEVFGDLLRREGGEYVAGDLSKFEFARAIGGQGFRFLAGGAGSFLWSVLVVGGLALAWRQRRDPVGAVLLVLVAMSVIAVGAVAQTRSAVGSFVTTSPQGRYAVLAVLPLLPIAGLLLQNGVRWVASRTRWPRTIAISSAAVLACGFTISILVAAVGRPEGEGVTVTNSVRRAMAAIISTPGTRQSRPDLALMPDFFDLDVSGVWALHDWGWYDPAPVAELRELLKVQARFFVHGEPRHPDDAPALLRPAASMMVDTIGRCTRLTPTNEADDNRVIIARSDSPVVFAVTEGAENIDVQARRDDARSGFFSLLSDPETDDIRVHPDAGVQIVLELTGPVTICDADVEQG